MFFVGNFKVLTTCTLTVLVPELLTSGLLAYTIGPLGFSEKKKNKLPDTGGKCFQASGETCDDVCFGGLLDMIGRKKQRDSRFFGPETGKVLHIFRYIQSIATSHDLTPNGRVVGQPPHKWPYFRTIQVGETLQFVYILYIIYVYIYIHMYIHIHIISTPVPKKTHLIFGGFAIKQLGDIACVVSWMHGFIPFFSCHPRLRHAIDADHIAAIDNIAKRLPSRGRKFTFVLGGGFKYFLIFTPTWGNDPTWLIFFKGVETTN